jgi:hypothetical protein
LPEPPPAPRAGPPPPVGVATLAVESATIFYAAINAIKELAARVEALEAGA